MLYVFSLIAAFVAGNSLANTCDKIIDLGFPVTGSCEVIEENIENIEAQTPIIGASVCWGGFGSSEDGQHAVAVQMITGGTSNEIIDYVWDMPTGRANRTNVNDYTYYGRWKKGVFFEDQTTIKEDGAFFKAFYRQGVVINYKDKEIEIVRTRKPFLGRLETQIDAYLKCGKF